MIDNVILLITGTLHERDTHELIERCHPLGVFDSMPALCVASNVEELYHTVLVETPTSRRPSTTITRSTAALRATRALTTSPTGRRPVAKLLTNTSKI